MDPQTILTLHKHLEEELVTEVQQQQKLQQHLQLLEELKEYLRVVRNKVVTDVITSVQGFVSNFLQVMGSEYEFDVELDVEKGTCKLLIKQEGEIRDPKYELGGGVLDLVSTGLRFGLWAVGGKTPILALDEPFRFLSRDYKPLMGEILLTFAKHLNLTIIIVTHDPDLVPVVNDNNVIVYDTRGG